jgi:hypothetical protein
MTDYNESTVSGTQYTRCHRIVIENPMSGDKYVRFYEEDAINIPDDMPIRRERPAPLGLRFDDPATEIPLRNPETWALTGETVTMGALYIAIASAYWMTAEARDAAEASPIEATGLFALAATL